MTTSALFKRRAKFPLTIQTFDHLHDRPQALPRLGIFLAVTLLGLPLTFTGSGGGDISLESDEELDSDEDDGGRAREPLEGDKGEGAASGICFFGDSFCALEWNTPSNPCRLCDVL